MPQPIEVLHVVERIDDHYGGPAKSIPFTAWSATTAASSHRIYAGRYTATDSNSTCEELGVPYQQFDLVGSRKLGFSPGMAMEILRFIRESENPVVHIHNSWNFVPFWVWLISHFVRFRIVISVRGALFPWSLDQGRGRKKIAWALFQKSLLRRADAVHVTSSEERDQLWSLGIHENLVQIPNGVSVSNDMQPRNVQHPEGQANGPLGVLFVSRLHPKKGVDILFSALADPAIDFEVQLTLAGSFSDDDYRQKIAALEEELPITVSVNFVGHVGKERLADLFAKADVFVLPSHSENFGIAIAEALSHGLPVITTIHTPWHDIARRGAGYVIDSDSGQLAAALKDFRRHSGRSRQQMETNARELVADYDWRRLGPAYAAMYNRIAG